MKKTLAILALAAAIVAAPIASSAQALTDGVVTKIDASAKKITIKHGPMKKFDMDEGMTMVYAVKDPALLGKVKSGDKVKFDADNVNGQFVVTTIEKAK
jgi:Cu/Ag efflux protein CusF